MLSLEISPESEWQERAACRQPDLHDLFFQTSTRAAKEICAGCPVREACLEFALETNQTYGVWGGKSPYQRLKLRKERNATTGDS